MEAQDAFKTNRQIFDDDLAGLITAAATLPTPLASCSLEELPVASSMDDDGPVARSKRTPGDSSVQVSSDSCKRRRLTNLVHDKQDHVHPDRRRLQESYQADQQQNSFQSSDSHLAVKEESIHSEQSNALPRSSPRPPPIAPRAFARSTRLVKAIRRQHHVYEDNLEYEQLLEARRTEQVSGVDRYVPDARPATKLGCHPEQTQQYFPLMSLPTDLRERILGVLLIDQDPIPIHFPWARDWLAHRVTFPSSSKTIEGHRLSTPLDVLVSDVGKLQKYVEALIEPLSDFASHVRCRGSPCLGLTTSLLRVSRMVHKDAARVFYSSNIFAFPSSSTAWMQLESFLATIGPQNVVQLRSLRVHAPLWHPGLHEDFLEGAILDLTSPASRLAIITPPARDRLLSAMRYSVATLYETGGLTALTFDLGNSHMDYWTGRRTQYDRLISVKDAEEHAARRQEGIELLKFASEAMTTKPILRLYHARWPQKREVAMFRSRLVPVIREAEKYGWQVD